MRIPRAIHRWSLTPRQAIALQQRLRGRVRVEPLVWPVRRVAGADMAFSPDGRRCVAGVVVYDLQTHEVVEQALAWRDVRFPYVPGLLSFREAPAVLAAVRKLKIPPDAFILDAQGYSHPRRLGLASHVGLLMESPTVGCAKSRLCGTHDDPPAWPGTFAPLRDGDEVIGAVLRTRPGVKPVYVSVGHRVTLDDAVRLVMTCVTRYRVCEPTRLAHQLVTRHRGDMD
ncbi:MAG: endonuclease V [Planctomycetes bacterium]|nr:endonuclease V [Planctomycetota bacterium]